MWKFLKNRFLDSPIDNAQLDRQLADVLRELPAPVFWLLGKTQSGKTAIVHALTGHERARIGDGFESCTRYSRVYHFPDAGNCLMRFLDTRGLGEVDYDAKEDIELFSRQAHVLILVMKAMDQAQKPLIDSLQPILKQRPEWPVVVAQTCLHEGYERPTDPHVEPYPFQHPGIPGDIPQRLARSLQRQRELIRGAGIDAFFVPIDFTRAEDGYEHVFYGLEDFWNVLEQALPQGVGVLLRDAGQARERIHNLYHSTVHPHIISHSVAAGMAGAVPLPLVDTPLVVAIQLKLFRVIAGVYGQPLNLERLQDIGGVLGVGFVSNLGKRQVLKLIPAYGAAAASVLTAATTYALGKTLDLYFSHVLEGGIRSRYLYRDVYRKQLEQGKELLKGYVKSGRTRKNA